VGGTIRFPLSDLRHLIFGAVQGGDEARKRAVLGYGERELEYPTMKCAKEQLPISQKLFITTITVSADRFYLILRSFFPLLAVDSRSWISSNGFINTIAQR